MPQIDKKPVQVINLTKEASTMRHRLYNSQQWRNLRKIYRQTHPICENCLEQQGVINAEGIQIHHIQSPFEAGLDELERWRRLLDYSNLRALCPTCHANEHNKKKVKKNKKKDKKN